jgi:hypothetical protein
MEINSDNKSSLLLIPLDFLFPLLRPFLMLFVSRAHPNRRPQKPQICVSAGLAAVRGLTRFT